MTDEEFDQMLSMCHERGVLLKGAEHKEECKCPVCHEWWQMMGTDEYGTFGPFTAEEMIIDPIAYQTEYKAEEAAQTVRMLANFDKRIKERKNEDQC